MNKNEFVNMIEKLQEQIGVWRIVVGEDSEADFVLGCYFNTKSEQWIVYINTGRGRKHIRLQTDSEEKAFDKLFSMIQFEIENHL